VWDTRAPKPLSWTITGSWCSCKAGRLAVHLLLTDGLQLLEEGVTGECSRHADVMQDAVGGESAQSGAWRHQPRLIRTHQTLPLYVQDVHHGSCTTRQYTVILLHAAVTASNTHTHPFNGPFSATTQVSQYQKRKTNLDFTEG